MARTDANSEGPQTFTWGQWVWNIDEMLQAHRDDAPRDMDISGAAGLLGFGLVSVDEAHVPTVDLTVPIVVVPAPGAADMWLPIDGWHRIAKALGQGLAILPAIFLTEDQSARYRTHA